jgi:hypothetical protein
VFGGAAAKKKVGASKSAPATYGTKREVYLGLAHRTRGGLTKKDIIVRQKPGQAARYVSKKQSEQARAAMAANPAFAQRAQLTKAVKEHFKLKTLKEAMTKMSRLGIKTPDDWARVKARS